MYTWTSLAFFYSTIACFWAYTNPTKSPKCSSVYFVCTLSFSLDGVCVDTSPLNQRMNYWVAFLYQIMTHIPLPWSEYTANKIEMCFLSRPTVFPLALGIQTHAPQSVTSFRWSSADWFPHLYPEDGWGEVPYCRITLVWIQDFYYYFLACNSKIKNHLCIFLGSDFWSTG